MFTNSLNNAKQFSECVCHLSVEHKEIKDDICVFKITLDHNHIVIYDTIRLCYKLELEDLYNDTFKFIDKINNEHRKLDNYQFCKSDIKEIYRKNGMNSLGQEYFISKEDVFNDNVNIKDLSLLMFDLYTENIYEYGCDIPLPKSVHFDYMSGNVDNGHYVLEEVLKILENRNDVIINEDKYTFKIREIPYYNISGDKDKYIDFNWIPTDEDWKKYVESEYFNKYNRYDYILDEIIGLRRINNEDK